MPLQKMNPDEFARRLKPDSELPDKRFAFFLGAGCSITSRIPGSAFLVKKRWLPKLYKLRAPKEKDIDNWAKKEFPDYDPDNPADSYGNVMENLFLQPGERQREIERLCDGKFPGFGYTVLATLMGCESSRFNVVITTNFDNLMFDAQLFFTQIRPIVISHEALEYISPTRVRPLIIKLHGDARLSPKNTIAETKNIHTKVVRQVSTLLHGSGLIFIGYGGNDKGIAKMFSALPNEALPFGVYWINTAEPKGALRPWLDKRDATWVKISFDKMMLLIRYAFNLPHPDKEPFDNVFKRYFETYNKLSKRIRSTNSSLADEALQEAINRADSELADWSDDLSGWLSVLLRAQKLENTDHDKAKKLYNDGINKYPNSTPLRGAYALFLEQVCKEYDLAEQHYLLAYSANPHQVNTLVNFAGFLLSHEKKDEGVQLLEKAISLLPDPESPETAVEIWFYAFAHRFIKKRSAALTKLKKALLEGDRSSGRDLSANIAQARKDKHPDIEWFEKLAAVINEKEEISILDTWDKWKDA